MTQPCKNFKICKRYAYDRHAKHCASCWKNLLELQRSKTPLKEIRLKEGMFEFEFKNKVKGCVK